nr:MAG TPA: hypothetical protein [Caudoviricetes sp.]
MPPVLFYTGLVFFLESLDEVFNLQVENYINSESFRPVGRKLLTSTFERL